MHISELRIRNFRNFASARFKFRQGVNTLIGENGAGKSNALEALRFLLDDGLPRNALRLRESDFARHIGDWRGEWIVIAADFAKLDPSEGCQLIKHAAGHMDGSGSGTCTFFFRPRIDVRVALRQNAGNRTELERVRASLTIDDYEAILTGRGLGDFLDTAVYRSFVGSRETGIYPDPLDDDQAIAGVRISSIHQEVACTHVRALRDVVAELRGYRKSPILALLRGMSTSIDSGEAAKITDLVSTLNSDISSLKAIRDLASRIEAVLSSAVGHTYGPSIAVESALPDKMDALLQKLTVLVGDPGSPHKGELHEQSLGAANLIYLALKLLEYDAKLASDRVAHFLLVEEPEAHIHTHVQRALFENLESPNTQIILTTHSTHISSAARIDGMNVLARQGEYAEVFHPSAGLPRATAERIERYLDAVRTTLLFSKGVILVEGDAELVMVPAMLKAALGVTTDELGFSVISMSSAVFTNIATLFHPERIRRPCAIVTDRDAALCALPSDPASDTEIQGRARASELAGRTRLAALHDAHDDNPWVQVFSARYTFEVDLVHAGNQPAFESVLGSVYSQNARIEGSKTELAAGNVRAGTEALRLAEKVGKGWFALLLSSGLGKDVVIPDYIRQAVAFACCQSMNESTFRRMAAHRRAAGCYAAGAALDSDSVTAAYADDALSVLWREVLSHRTPS